MRRIAQALINRMTDGHKAHTMVSRVLRHVPLALWDKLGRYAWKEEA